MQKQVLSVIVPVYNEENTILQILERVLKQKSVFEVIIIDDGSRDHSVEIVEKFIKKKPRVKLLVHLQNQGKGAAIINGIKKAQGDFIIIQDADLEYYPEDYSKLLQPLLRYEAEFVLGNRWQEKRRGYFLAQMGNRYINVLTNLLFGCRMCDSYTGYKAGHRKIWQGLKLISNGFEIEAEITAKLAKYNVKFKEVPIRYNPRTFSQGKKINWWDVLKGTKTLLRIRFKQ